MQNFSWVLSASFQPIGWQFGHQLPSARNLFAACFGYLATVRLLLVCVFCDPFMDSDNKYLVHTLYGCTQISPGIHRWFIIISSFFKFKNVYYCFSCLTTRNVMMQKPRQTLSVAPDFKWSRRTSISVIETME